MNLCKLVQGEIYYHPVSQHHYQYHMPAGEQMGYVFLNMELGEWVTFYTIDVYNLELSLLGRKELQAIADHARLRAM